MSNPNIRFMRTRPDAQIPKPQTTGSAGAEGGFGSTRITTGAADAAS